MLLQKEREDVSPPANTSSTAFSIPTVTILTQWYTHTLFTAPSWQL